jgi:hypothetical protein
MYIIYLDDELLLEELEDEELLLLDEDDELLEDEEEELLDDELDELEEDEELEDDELGPRTWCQVRLTFVGFSIEVIDGCTSLCSSWHFGW